MRYFQHSRIPSRSCFFNCKAGNCDDTDTIVWRLTWTMETNGRVNRTSARKSLSRLTVSESVCQTRRQSTHSWSISFGIVAFVSSLPGKAERSDVTNASVQVSRVDERNLPAAIKRSTVSSHGELKHSSGRKSQAVIEHLRATDGSSSTPRAPSQNAQSLYFSTFFLTLISDYPHTNTSPVLPP